jgi:D-sedoheptulose 7-phosphate isomerase
MAEGNLAQAYRDNLGESLSPCVPELVKAHEVLAACFLRGGKLLICGNGGSFADALHISAELLKKFERLRPLRKEYSKKLSSLPFGEILSDQLEEGFPVVALGNNGAVLTALINDKDDPRLLFAQETLALGREGDVLMGLSTSGNAEDIRMAMSVAKVLGMTTVTLTGYPGGKMSLEADIAVKSPATITARVQEQHVRIYHALCAQIEKQFFPE